MLMDVWLRTATQQLQAAGIGTPRLDALVLLEDCLDTGRAQLLAHPEQQLTAELIHVLDAQIVRRARHEPLAYIRGKTEFYGRVFSVNKNVLVPRPESETMIELLNKLELPPKSTVIDIGTGSGALIITAKMEMPLIRAYGIDIDPKCLSVAETNAAQHKVDIGWLEGDLLQPLLGKSGSANDLAPGCVTLLCNLPYVPDNFQINLAAGHEPRLAIYGGQDGLDVYRRLFAQLKQAGWRPRYVLAEALPPSHAGLAAIAGQSGYRLASTDDFIQVFMGTE